MPLHETITALVVHMATRVKEGWGSTGRLANADRQLAALKEEKLCSSVYV